MRKIIQLRIMYIKVSHLKVNYAFVSFGTQIDKRSPSERNLGLSQCDMESLG